MGRGDLSETEWRVLAPLLPPVKGRWGRPAFDRRGTMNSILWRLRTGSPRRDVPERYGHWNSMARYFRRWCRNGIWEAMAVTLAETMADNRYCSFYATTVRGHVSAAGAKRGTREQAFGRSRGGFTCKVRCVVDAEGRPLGFHLIGGKTADCKSYDILINLPGKKPTAILADKGYASDMIRADLEARGIRAVIPPRSKRKRHIRWNKRLYRQRNFIERAIGDLKINHAIATRYDKLARHALSRDFQILAQICPHVLSS